MTRKGVGKWRAWKIKERNYKCLWSASNSTLHLPSRISCEIIVCICYIAFNFQGLSRNSSIYQKVVRKIFGFAVFLCQLCFPIKI